MSDEHLLPFSSIRLREGFPTLFQVLTGIADGLHETLGEICEVVIHDLSNPRSSIVHITNGKITNREIGDGIRDLAMILRSEHFRGDKLANYVTRTEDGKIVKSMTVVIRDDQDHIVGAFCLNLDLSRFLQSKSVLEEFTSGFELDEPQHETPIHDRDVQSILHHIITQTILETATPVSTMDRETRIQIVQFLDEREVFSVKGAVDHLAEQLGVSRYTIYNYLDEARNRKAREKR